MIYCCKQFQEMKIKAPFPQNNKKPRVSPNSKGQTGFHTFNRTPTKNIFQKTPPKNTPLMGVTFSSHVKKKSNPVVQPTSQIRRGKVHRNFTLQLHDINPDSDIDNIEERSNTGRSLQMLNDEYFSRSLSKVSQIRSKYSKNSISMQLNEVLNMIKQQKLKINQKMKILKRNNEYYRQICEGYKARTVQRGTNSIDMIDRGINQTKENKLIQVETQQLQLPSSKSIKESRMKQNKVNQKEVQTYVKLYAMLQDMGIEYHTILPQMPVQMSQNNQSKKYKGLSDTQVIKIQKFFIQKLATKLHN